MNMPDSPFSVIAFAPFLAEDAPELQRTDQPLSISSADQGLSLLTPSLYIPLPRILSPECGIQLAFRQLDDFTPESIIARTPWLKALAADSKQERQRERSSATVSDPLATILEMVAVPEGAADSGPEDRSFRTEADTILGGVLNRIFTDAGFRSMEAAWRGVALLFRSHVNGPLSLSLIPVQRDTVVEAIERTARHLDAEPPDLLLCGMAFDATPPGMQILEAASTLAERLLTPTLCWCGPDFFHAGGWDGLTSLPYLPHHLDGFSYARWKTLRTRQAACWTLAACNGLVIRQPHRCGAGSGFFQEQAALLAAPVWGVAALMLKAVDQTGLLCRTAEQNLRSSDGDDTGRSTTEAAIPDDRLQQLLACGIIPLVSLRNNRFTIPDLLSIDGSGPAPSMALSWLIHTLIRMRAEHGPAEDRETLASELRQALSEPLKNQTVACIEELQITSADSTDNGAVVLSVKLRPTGAERTKIIEFTFDW